AFQEAADSAFSAAATADSAATAAATADSAATAAAATAAAAAAFSAATAAFSAADSAAATAAATAFSAATAAFSAADSAAAAASEDTTWPGEWPALWPGNRMPEGLAVLWPKMEQRLSAAPEKWAFWLDWYRAILVGKPMNWALTQQIAKEVTELQWDAGSKAVAERIEEIKNLFWAESLPQHETLEADSVTGKYTIRALPFEPKDAVERWLKQIEFATSLAIDSNTNDFNRMNTAFKFIDHSLDSCRDDPNAIEQNLGIAHGILEGNLSDPEFHKDDSVIALATVVRQIQIQMRADHPDVRKAWEKRIAQKLRETDRETKLMAAEAIRAETARTQGRLTIEMELDAEAAANTISEDAAAKSLSRAGGRSAKMNLLDRTGKTIKGIDNSAPYKATRMGTTGWSIVDFLQWLF
ncbi:hypothetical protein, partial [Sedimentitalea sp.]|uniref:hypothetical protein n=1 Tax=Sedimentitalea sp. TaxID=2048915 RepID=UPI0032663932